jgi:hypothetical protein
MQQQQALVCGTNIKSSCGVWLMQRQLFLAHFYYMPDPQTIMSTTEVQQAIKDLWPAFMEGPCPSHTQGMTIEDKNLLRIVQDQSTR